MHKMFFEKLESNVRSYCRNFTDLFDKAKGSLIYSEDGKEFVDFFSGAGALNYGHNNEYIKEKILTYIQSDRIMHGLDFYTVAKRDFIKNFDEKILQSKKLNYKFQFCGTTGTNAVEAAIKLARKVKKRSGLFSFTGAFHGMTLGSLSLTGNKESREGAGISLNSNVSFFPYCYNDLYHFDSLEYMETILEDTHSGVEKPAAVICETVQAEGGIIVAPVEWLQRLKRLCEKHDILFICDDIQVGCGRAGNFFSFERAGIVPDIVILSKSISGYGLPMSLLLFKPEFDVWMPAEHNGTFRGNQLAFIGASAALDYWESVNLEKQVKEKMLFISDYIKNEILPINNKLKMRGIGMIWGIEFSSIANFKDILKKITATGYSNGLIFERAGRNDSVVKIMPPLNIEIDLLEKGLKILKNAVKSVLASEYN